MDLCYGAAIFILSDSNGCNQTEAEEKQSSFFLYNECYSLLVLNTRNITKYGSMIKVCSYDCFHLGIIWT